MIDIVLSERDFDYELQALVTGFFPGVHNRVLIQPEQEDAALFELAERESGDGISLLTGVFLGQYEIRGWVLGKGHLHRNSVSVSGGQDFHKHVDKTTHPYRTSYKNKLKKLLFELYSSIPEEELPEGIQRSIPVWGTMTGVRPTKIPMNRLLEGEPLEQVRRSMEEEYCCSGGKAELCLDIAVREAKLLQKAEYNKGYSLYIGIPFCPSTCLYCSFPSYPLERFQALIPDYLEALKKEIRFCAGLQRGKRLTSVYIGGGTPTTLSAGQMEELLQCLYESFPVNEAAEITVEAGRPDSITREKLMVLRKFGVERISVNPQTMQDKTLQSIGRHHTVEQTKEVFALARECGFENINMDLIIGLPGETPEDFENTLEQIRKLDPDSITIHSLVVKRASRLRRLLDEGAVPEEERARRMEKMMEMGLTFAAENGYQPYYMYRQKNTAGYAGSSGQENIGFAREGKECLYNILIMEEMQSIAALGAGASTKCYDRQRHIVSRVENVKSVTDYISHIDEMLQRKQEHGMGD